jgi:hypothetical protein
VNGWCSPWKWGSSREFETPPDMSNLASRNHREGIAYFPGDWTVAETGSSLTQGECEEKCEADVACEQAVFRVNTHECWLGVETMSANHGSGHAEGFDNSGNSYEEKCFAKRGFDVHSPRSGRLRNGYCGDDLFREGFEPGNTKPCDPYDRDVEDQLHCSYWPSTFKLSPEGCWARCDANEHCTQAVYTKRLPEAGSLTGAETDYDYECRIGTFIMEKGYFDGATSWESQCINAYDCTGQVDFTYVKTYSE